MNHIESDDDRIISIVARIRPQSDTKLPLPPILEAAKNSKLNDKNLETKQSYTIKHPGNFQPPKLRGVSNTNLAGLIQKCPACKENCNPFSNLIKPLIPKCPKAFNTKCKTKKKIASHTSEPITPISISTEETYEIGKQLGQGAFATVKEAFNKKNLNQYALKIYEKFHFFNSQNRSNVDREISILKKLSHPNIVKLHEVIETSNKLILVQELVRGRSLSSYYMHHLAIFGICLQCLTNILQLSNQELLMKIEEF